MNDMVRIGDNVTRVEDFRFLTGTGHYIDDIRLDGQVEAAFLRSPFAHARITSLDVSAARAAPGVVLVATGAEWVAAGHGPIPTKNPVRKFRDGRAFQEPVHHCLAVDSVHHAGEPIVMVVAETKSQALDAVELIEIDYEELPSVVEQTVARKDGAPQLWEVAPGNISVDFELGNRSEVEAGMASADHVVTLDVRNNRVTAVPMEPRGCVGAYDAAAETYTLWNSSQNIHANRFFRDMPSRFAILPRYGDADSVMWFEAEATYVLHWLNAWEEGDEVILDGYYQEEPQPKSYPDAPEGMERMMAYLDQQLLKPKLHRWRFNRATGETREERLDDRILEFGMFNQQYAGRPYRYAYSAVPEPGWFLFRGLVKHDLVAGTSEEIAFGPGRYGSETPFAPRINAQDEDDGYLVSFIADVNTDRSECVLIDAKNIAAGPVCRIILPERICSATHSVWAAGDAIGMPENSVLA